MVEHQTMSDQNQKLSEQTKNTPDILSDEKNLRQNYMHNQIMPLSHHKLKISCQTFNQRKFIVPNK